jgi:serine/threonine protein kinase
MSHEQAALGLRAAPIGTLDTQIIIDEGATTGVTPSEQSEPSSATANGHQDSRSLLGSAGSSGRASPLEFLDVEEDPRLASWKRGEALGRGAYGEVFKAMVAGRFMAVKKIPLELTSTQVMADKEISALKTEINTLRRLNHKRIVRYHGCITQTSEDDPALLIFLEFMPSGSIKGVLSKFGPYGLGLARKYTLQILEGLQFLHENKIIHRDVKGANILIDAHGDSKLADFGACREIEALHSTVTSGMKSIQGSVYWMAPEVMKYKAGRRSDIWSLGCTVIEMITAEPPWKELRDEKLGVTETLKRIVEGEGSPPLPDCAQGNCKTFLQIVLVRDHTQRPYAKQLLGHRFVASQDHHRTSAEGSGSRQVETPATTEAWGARPTAELLS